MKMRFFDIKQVEKVYSYFWMLWVALFFPLVVIDYSLSKSFIGLIAFICLVYSCIHFKMYTIDRLEKPQILAAIVIVFFMFVGFFSYIMYISEYANKKYFRELETLIIALIILLSVSPSASKRLRDVLLGSIIVFVLCASIVIIYKYNFINDENRPSYATKAAIPAATVLAIMSFWMIMDSRLKIVFVSFPVFVISLYALALNQSRASWLTLFAMTTIYFLSRWYKMKLLLKIISVGIAVVLFTIFVNIPQVNQRISLAYDQVTKYNGMEKSSIGLRFIFWEYALQELKEDPISMRGFTDTHQRLMLRRESNENSIHFQYIHMHNEIVQQWFQKGIFGLFSIILMLLLPFILLTNLPFFERLILSTGFFVGGLTNVLLYSNLALLSYLILLVIIFHSSRKL